MPSKQRRQRHAINQRAYQNGFEAGADEATKRWGEKLDQAQKTIKELSIKLDWQKRDEQRARVACELISAVKMIIDP